MELRLIQLTKAVSIGNDACNVLILILKEIVLDLPQATSLICIHKNIYLVAIQLKMILVSK